MNKTIILYVSAIILLLYGLSMVGCKEVTNPEPSTHLVYTTDIDSARYYYDLGWLQIMDQGFYGPSELSYRSSLAHDPQFLLSAATLARLTLDLEERKKLLQVIIDHKEAIPGNERLILDVYQSFIELTNARQENHPKMDSIRANALDLALNNFGAVVRVLPEESYLFAEYIEIIHALQGPQQAIDSLSYYIAAGHQSNIFLDGYRASMLSELDQYAEAMKIADKIAQKLPLDIYPKPNAVYADIYYQSKEYRQALPYALRGNDLDPRNLDLSRLLAKIKKELTP